MVRDLAAAACAGPGLVLVATMLLDRAGVLEVEGVVQRFVVVIAVVVGLVVFALLQRRQSAADDRTPDPVS